MTDQQQSSPLVTMQRRRDELAEAIRQLDGKIMAALEHGYEGYKLDTDQHGKPFYGSTSHREFEKDRAKLQRLRDELSDVKEQIRDETSQAQSSADRAMQIIQKVYGEEAAHVPKNIIPDLQRFFRDGLRTVDWTVPQLRSDQSKEGMVRMVFSYAAHEARKLRAANRGNGGASTAEGIDGEHEEAGEQQTEPDKNEFGHEKGSVAHDISERYKRLRTGNAGILGEVKK